MKVEKKPIMQNEALGIELDAIEGKKEGRSKSAFCLRNKISETAGTKCQMTRNERLPLAAAAKQKNGSPMRHAI